VADAWIRVSLTSLSENVKVVKAYLASSPGKPPKLMAVVKADAYGHGAARSANAFRGAGADAFGVTTLSEALELCEAGIQSQKTPILVFAPLVTPDQARIALKKDLHLTVCDEDQVRLVSKEAKTLGKEAALHLKVDTGMGRLGLPPKEALRVAQSLADKANARWAGVYTHFARAAEKDLAPTKAQLGRFEEFCRDLKAAGIQPEMRHTANSAAVLRLPESRLDMVRAGTVLYGQYPSAFVPKVPGLQEKTWIMQARVVFVHDLSAGSPVGYGAETTVRRKTRAAVIPVGFADGFAVSPNSLFRGKRGLRAVLRPDAPHVLLQGFKAPVLGRVAMQMIVVDVTDLPEFVRPGDIAEIPVRRLSANARLPKVYEEKKPANKKRRK
jgi:alanine racemase